MSSSSSLVVSLGESMYSIMSSENSGRQVINFQNIQTAHTAQYKKKNKKKKWAEDLIDVSPKKIDRWPIGT